MKTFETHGWVHPISVAYVPGKSNPALEQATPVLLDWLKSFGCTIEDPPTNTTDLIITTASFGEPVDRDQALLFHAKRLYRLNRRPTVLTLVSIEEAEYQKWLAHFAELARQPEGANLDEQFPGLGPRAIEVMAQQAKRGGPEVALGRFLQSQMKSVRVVAVRTDSQGRPRWAVHFDLAGAHPVTDASDLAVFAREIGLQILAAACAHEVDHHDYFPEPVPQDLWEKLDTPDAMIQAGVMFTEYGFFTTPVYIEKLLGYRGIGDAISAQYSEGCYAVFEPEIPGLISTATGSSRLVDKRLISRSDQAVIVGVKSERDGAVVRPVAGMERVVPSVEAVEMMGVCEAVPSHLHTNSRGEQVRIPNIRAILHGHLGVATFKPEYVESVSLDPPYYMHLVSCGTGALAQGTAAAFARSAALRDLNDPRGVIFLEQPGHGVVVVEKWVEGKAPFETIREYLDAGHIKITMAVPQGVVQWEQVTLPDGQVVMQKAADLVKV